MTKTTEYQKDLIEALKVPSEAAAYLNAAIEEGDHEIFRLAANNVAESKPKSFSTLRTKMTPESRARSEEQTRTLLEKIRTRG